MRVQVERESTQCGRLCDLPINVQCVVIVSEEKVVRSYCAKQHPEEWKGVALYRMRPDGGGED
jgi:hypothetical protein